MDWKIGYVGKDDRFFKSVKLEFEDIYGAENNFEFFEYWDEAEGSHVRLIHQIIEDQSDILYLDYSTNLEEMVKLGYLLRNLNATNEMIVVGLLNPLDKESIRSAYIKRIIQTGVRVNQIKMGGQPQDPVYDGVAMKFPKSVKEPNIVAVKSKDGIPSRFAEIMRISMISLDEVLVESNMNLQADEIIELETYIPDDVLPSKQFRVIEMIEGETYYRMLYKYRLQPCYIDVVDESKAKSDPMEAERVRDEKRRREEQVRTVTKPAFESWIFNQMKESRRKVVKSLIIDRQLTILDQAKKWIDDYSYSIRLQTNFEQNDKLLDLYQPHMIVWVMEELPPPPEPDPDKPDAPLPEIRPEDYNTVTSLKLLTEKLTSSSLSCSILVFDAANETSDTLKEKTGYEKIIASSDAFSFYAVDKMLTVLKNKITADLDSKDKADAEAKRAELEAKRQEQLKALAQAKKQAAALKAKSKKVSFGGKKKEEAPVPEPTLPELPEFNPDVPRFYVDKTSDFTNALCWQNCKIMDINEVHLDFESERILPHYTSYIIDKPAQMYVTVIPQKESSPFLNQKGMAYALIHSIETEARKELRANLIRNKS